MWLPQVQQEVKQVEFFLKELSLAGAAFFIGNHSSD
jgi:hypothetical protein